MIKNKFCKLRRFLNLKSVAACLAIAKRRRKRHHPSNFNPQSSILYNFFLSVFFISSVFLTVFADDPSAFVQREDVQQFMNDISTKDAFEKPALEKLFSQIKLNDISLDKKRSSDISPMPWYQFRAVFMQQDRIQMGVQYWGTHKKILDDVAVKYGVPPNIIVAIIGVETKFGNYQGDFRVINSLATLAFNYPPKEAFFKYELEQFLLMCRKYNLDPLSINGSYSGAMGKLQFMPHSMMQYFVQYDPSKPLDFSNNDDDIIVSIANYLKQHGWQTDEPVAQLAVIGDNFDEKKLPPFVYQPKISIADLDALDIHPDQKIDPHQMAFVVRVEGENNPNYFLGFHNLSVLMTYNQNIRYGLVVNELSEAIQKEFTK